MCKTGTEKSTLIETMATKRRPAAYRPPNYVALGAVDRDPVLLIIGRFTALRR